jgi:chorismate mutase
VEANTSAAIVSATRELLEQIVVANTLHADEIAGVIFTATPDLNATYPARAAREMGWVNVPLMCMQEMTTSESLPRCIRVLLFWNSDKTPDQINHVYLGKARSLRPDLMEGCTT